MTPPWSHPLARARCSGQGRRAALLVAVCLEAIWLQTDRCICEVVARCSRPCVRGLAPGLLRTLQLDQDPPPAARTPGRPREGPLGACSRVLARGSPKQGSSPRTGLKAAVLWSERLDTHAGLSTARCMSLLGGFWHRSDRFDEDLLNDMDIPI